MSAPPTYKFAFQWFFLCVSVRVRARAYPHVHASPRLSGGVEMPPPWHPRVQTSSPCHPRSDGKVSGCLGGGKETEGGLGGAQGSLLCSSVSRSHTHTHTHTVKNKQLCTQTFTETKTEKYSVKFCEQSECTGRDRVTHLLTCCSYMSTEIQTECGCLCVCVCVSSSKCPRLKHWELGDKNL